MKVCAWLERQVPAILTLMICENLAWWVNRQSLQSPTQASFLVLWLCSREACPLTWEL